MKEPTKEQLASLNNNDWKIIRQFEGYLVAKYNQDFGNWGYTDHGLSEKLEEQSKWRRGCLNKFILGRLEHHDDDVTEIDCAYEIQQEKMDIEAYEFIQKLQDNGVY